MPGDCNCLDCRCGRGEEVEEPEVRCDVCDEVESDCTCVTCEGCSRRRQDVCSECTFCERCGCECSSGDDEEDSGAPFRDGSRLVGVELEYNECSERGAIRRFLSTWRAGHHEDGSCGWEVVTAPISGKYIDRCLTDLGEALRDSGARADERCGVHVHVDASDYTWADMYRLLHVYAKLEPILYMLGGQHRALNDYCAPVGEKYVRALGNVDRKGTVLGVAYGAGEAAEARHFVWREQPTKKAGGRYKGLNICPWLVGRRYNTKRGAKRVKKDTTVEFRLHRNTLDTKRVAGWAKLCAAIVTWCATASDKEAAALPRSGLRALMVIAPDSRDWILRRIKAWRGATSHATGVVRRMSTSGGKWSIKCVD